MMNLSRTVFALLTFVCMWHILTLAKLQRAAVIGTALGVFVTAASLAVGQSSYRGTAFFQHPNYAGHYMAMACMRADRRGHALVLEGPRGRWRSSSPSPRPARSAPWPWSSPCSASTRSGS